MLPTQAPREHALQVVGLMFLRGRLRNDRDAALHVPLEKHLQGMVMNAAGAIREVAECMSVLHAMVDIVGYGTGHCTRSVSGSADRIKSKSIRHSSH